MALAALAYRDPLIRGWRILFLLPMLFMPSAVSFIWKLAFNDGRVISDLLMRLGLIDGNVDFLAIVWLARLTLIVTDVWQWTPFLFIIFVAALQGQDEEIEEAARLDGASWRAIFWNISLPMMRPVIAVALVLRGIDIITMFTTSTSSPRARPGGATETMSYFIYRTGFKTLRLRLCLGRLGGDADPDHRSSAQTRREALLPLGEGLMATRRKARGESLVLRYLILGAWALVCLAADPLVPARSACGRAPRSSRRSPIYLPTFSLDAWRMIWADWPMARLSCATRCWRSRARVVIDLAARHPGRLLAGALRLPRPRGHRLLHPLDPDDGAGRSSPSRSSSCSATWACSTPSGR